MANTYLLNFTQNLFLQSRKIKKIVKKLLNYLYDFCDFVAFYCDSTPTVFKYKFNWFYFRNFKIF